MKRKILYLIISFFTLSCMFADSSAAAMLRLNIPASSSYEIGFSAQKVEATSDPIVSLGTDGIKLTATLPDNIDLNEDFSITAASNTEAWVYWKLVSMDAVTLSLRGEDDIFYMYAESDADKTNPISYSVRLADSSGREISRDSISGKFHTKSADVLEDVGSYKISVESSINSTQLDSIKAEKYTSHLYVILEVN